MRIDDSSVCIGLPSSHSSGVYVRRIASFVMCLLASFEVTELDVRTVQQEVKTTNPSVHQYREAFPYLRREL